MKAKLLTLITAALLALTLAGCDEKPGSSTTDEPQIVTVAPSDALSVDGFVVMRADSSDKTVTDASLRLKNAINEKVSGAAIEIGTDWVKRGDPVPPAHPRL